VAAAPPVPAPRYVATGLTGDYAGYASARELIDRLEREQGFDREYLQGVFSRVERQQWILDFVDRPKAKGKPRPGSWTRYSRKFVTDTRIDKGVRFWREHAADLGRAEARFGVPAEYVVAILGVETNYGGYLGSHKVINALATLAFDFPRRAEFFSGELEAFLVMARSEGFDPFEPVGSYAGAMGLGQFMPSSFHGYAVDFDGDGVRDLWNPADAIGSVANYFAGHGWRSGEPVAVTASARGQRARVMEAGYTSKYSPSTLAREGVLSSIPLDDMHEVSLLRLDTVSGNEYWIGLHNFYVITRYNHSTYYAMAVHQLAQALRERVRQPAGPVLSDARRHAAPVN
jgi:membrane-bound lytic murein transglycosylase B